MKGKTVLITGSTSGIGKETAYQLAQKGARIILTGRNQKKGNAAAEELKVKSGNPEIEFIQVDFSLQSDTRALAEKINLSGDPLHVLINNVATGETERKYSAEKVEMNLAVNHLNPFLLTHLLIPALKKAGSARVINVSSSLHFFGTVNLEDPDFKEGYHMGIAYGSSKLLGLASTYYFAEKFSSEGITFNAVDPGFSLTERAMDLAMKIGKSLPFLLPSMFMIDWMLPLEKAASVPVEMAYSTKLDHVSGKYFGPGIARLRSHRLTYDKAMQKKIWDWSSDQVLLKENS